MRSRRTNRMRLPNTASDDDGTLAFTSLHSDFAGYIETKGVPLMGTPLSLKMVRVLITDLSKI